MNLNEKNAHCNAEDQVLSLVVISRGWQSIFRLLL